MLARKDWHPSLTEDRILTAAEESMGSDEYIGFCLACGEEAYGVEPDARRYRCDGCNERQVYGAEELVLMSA